MVYAHFSSRSATFVVSIWSSRLNRRLSSVPLYISQLCGLVGGVDQPLPGHRREPRGPGAGRRLLRGGVRGEGDLRQSEQKRQTRAQREGSRFRATRRTGFGMHRVHPAAVRFEPPRGRRTAGSHRDERGGSALRRGDESAIVMQTIPALALRSSKPRATRRVRSGCRSRPLRFRSRTANSGHVRAAALAGGRPAAAQRPPSAASHRYTPRTLSGNHCS